MLTRDKRHANTDPYARIKRTPMSARERQRAINALMDAEVIVDVFLGIANRIKGLIARIGGRPTVLKASFKH